MFATYYKLILNIFVIYYYLAMLHQHTTVVICYLLKPT